MLAYCSYVYDSFVCCLSLLVSFFFSALFLSSIKYWCSLHRFVVHGLIGHQLLIGELLVAVIPTDVFTIVGGDIVAGDGNLTLNLFAVWSRDR